MIARLSGKLIEKSVDGIVIDVGGVGYEVHLPLSSFYSLPEEENIINLMIYTHVKEDALKLFGFITSKEKELFIKLIGVSGVGPKLALNILSGIEANDLAFAIANGDIPKMNSIPGVGKKTAERLILELKDKIKLEAVTGEEIRPFDAEDIFEDVLSALLNLGYKKINVEQGLAILKREQSEKAWSFETLLKDALKVLMKK